MEQPRATAMPPDRRRQRLRLARLEADMAYFQARLEMIRQPCSTNQLAQRKVFKLLNDTLATKANAIRRALELPS